ncbi:MAG: ATP-binding cassette domain-containing protein, partial [Bacilli bacterium]
YFLPLKSDLGTFTLFIEYITYGGAYILIFQEVFINYQSIIKFIDYTSTLMNISPTVFTRILAHTNQLDSLAINYPIKFEAFKLDQDKQALDLIINEGSILNITGEIGSGKSRFIDCLIGESQYLGNIYFDTQKLDHQQIDKISFVGQETLLFDESIINNITLFNEVDLEKLNKVLEISELNDEIFNDYLKNNTKIGVNGKLLSEGQRQRLSIARGLYVDSKLIILDDCFNNIDQSNKINIMNNLLKLNKTIIIVSNDTSIQNTLTSTNTNDCQVLVTSICIL